VKPTDLCAVRSMIEYGEGYYQSRNKNTTTSTMMTAQRGISLRRKPQESTQRLTVFANGIRLKKENSSKPICGLPMHAESSSFHGFKRSLFTTFRWSCWHRCNLYEFPITTGQRIQTRCMSSPREVASGSASFPNNNTDIPSWGIILEMLDKEHSDEIKFPESESTSRHWESWCYNERRNERYAVSMGEGRMLMTT
jgi:hypothetical protein